MRYSFISSVALFTLTIASAGSNATAQNLLKNGSFDSFSNGEPVAWTTSNIPGMLQLVSPSKESRSGKGGIKLEVKSFYGTKLAGTASQENIPLTTRQVRLSGYYTLASIRGDRAFVSLNLINENGSTIGVAHLTLEPTSSFRQFTIPLEVESGANVSRAKVGIALIAGTNDQLHEGTTAVFDDFKLEAGGSGTGEGAK